MWVITFKVIDIFNVCYQWMSSPIISMYVIINKVNISYRYISLPIRYPHHQHIPYKIDACYQCMPSPIRLMYVMDALHLLLSYYTSLTGTIANKIYVSYWYMLSLTACYYIQCQYTPLMHAITCKVDVCYQCISLLNRWCTPTTLMLASTNFVAYHHQ